MEIDTLHFEFQTNSSKIIKVIGVGGGGGNAVNHMYKEGFHDVTFVLCNTDLQDLKKSDIPIKVQLGAQTTNGLGAGNDPSVARKAAEESEQDIRNLFTDGTQMAFITAGMGGGTGTGAAPVVARIAKDSDILTVGIVTIPFLFEKTRKIKQALKGVEEMKKNVDALLVINNEKLRDIYTGLSTKEAYIKADGILSTATRSIAEIITNEGIINLDFRDVRKVLKNGGVAIMSIGTAKGEKRLQHAIDNALNSPLLNNKDVKKAKKILFNISASEKAPVLVEEMDELDKFMDQLDPNIEVIWGQAEDNSLEDEIKFTILATGFDLDMSSEGLNEEDNNEEDRKLEEKIKETYGDTVQSQRAINYFLFPDEDLDNDEIIRLFESTPTFDRPKGILEEMTKIV